MPAENLSEAAIERPVDAGLFAATSTRTRILQRIGFDIETRQCADQHRINVTLTRHACEIQLQFTLEDYGRWLEMHFVTAQLISFTYPPGYREQLEGLLRVLDVQLEEEGSPHNVRVREDSEDPTVLHVDYRIALPVPLNYVRLNLTVPEQPQMTPSEPSSESPEQVRPRFMPGRVMQIE
jgi:hypothetical protein